MDKLLGNEEHRSFDFRRHKFGVASPYPRSSIEKGSLLDSQEWPCPDWKPNRARLFRNADEYVIEIRGYKGAEWEDHYGVRFALDGFYPRVNWLVPEDSQEAAEEERRTSPKTFRYRFSPTDSRREVAIRVRDGRLRPRIRRLEYGRFLLARIEAANSSA